MLNLVEKFEHEGFVVEIFRDKSLYAYDPNDEDTFMTEGPFGSVQEAKSFFYRHLEKLRVNGQ